MEILIAIIGALLSGLFKIIGISMENSAKSEAAAAKRETAAVIGTAEAEDRIREAGREVERAGLRYEDVFMPRLDNVPQ
jgi:hypothetical protein